MNDRVDPRVERTREDVHAAVLALLREDGLQAVRHSRVAERSGVSRATVYRHWPDRAALLVSTLQAYRPVIVPPEPTGDLRADVLALARLFAHHLNTNEMLAEMMVLLRQADDDPDFAVVRAHLNPVRGNPVGDLLASARAAGEVREDLDEFTAAAALVGPMLMLRMMVGVELSDEQVQACVDHWLAGALAR